MDLGRVDRIGKRTN